MTLTIRKESQDNFPNIEFALNRETLDQLDQSVTEQSTDVVKLIMIAVKCIYTSRVLMGHMHHYPTHQPYYTIPYYSEKTVTNYCYCKSKNGVITKRNIIQCICDTDKKNIFDMNYLHLIRFEKKSEGQVELEFE